MSASIWNPGGAVPTELHRKLYEVKSVQDYGAIGDGTTDDTAAFIAAGTATAGPIFVPWTTSYYSLTSLTTALLSRLFGPGEIRVAGVITNIASSSSDAGTSEAAIRVNRPAHAPASNTFLGSVGRGAAYLYTNRTGGAGQYGSHLVESLVTAAMVANEFDIAATSWITATNMTGAGASVFGGWAGANTPWRTQTYVGGSAVGLEVNVGNRWADFGLQSDVGGTRYTVGVQIVPDVIPTTDTQSATVTMSSGSPGVVNWTGHALTANTPVHFSGAGLPAAVSAGVNYYVMSTGLTTNAFQISATLGGSAVNFATASTGTISAIPSFPGSFGLLLSRSIWDHRWWVGTHLRYDSIMSGGFAEQIAGGSSASYNVPAAITKVLGYWADGIDFSGAVFSGVPLIFSSSQTSATATAGAGEAMPSNVSGYIRFKVGATTFKIPYVAN